MKHKYTQYMREMLLDVFLPATNCIGGAVMLEYDKYFCYNIRSSPGKVSVTVSEPRVRIHTHTVGKQGVVATTEEVEVDGEEVVERKSKRQILREIPLDYQLLNHLDSIKLGYLPSRKFDPIHSYICFIRTYTCMFKYIRYIRTHVHIHTYILHIQTQTIQQYIHIFIHTCIHTYIHTYQEQIKIR